MEQRWRQTEGIKDRWGDRKQEPGTRDQGVCEETGVWQEAVLAWRGAGGNQEADDKLGRGQSPSERQVCQQVGRVSKDRSGGRTWDVAELAGDGQTNDAKVMRWTDVSVEEGGHLMGRCGGQGHLEACSQMASD